MIIWIDADSCPVQIRNIVSKAAEKRGIKLVLAANREIPVRKHSFVESVIVDAGADSADHYILENSSPGDLVITRDIPFASRLVEKGINVINDRGDEFTGENIGEKLSMRNFMLEIRVSGLKINEEKSFGNRDIQLFSNTFDKIVTKLLKNVYK